MQAIVNIVPVIEVSADLSHWRGAGQEDVEVLSTGDQLSFRFMAVERRQYVRVRFTDL